MGNKYKERGGGAATGLADDLIGFLSSGLNTGTFGTRSPAGGGAYGSTIGIAGVLNDLLSGGAGTLGGSMGDLIRRDTDRSAEALRAGYSMGGTGYGTPAAFGEAVLRSEQAPKLATAIGGMQMQAILPLLQMITGLSSKGISQRQGIVEPNPWASIASIAAPAIGMLAGGPLGGMLGGALGGMFGGGGSTQLPPMGPVPFGGFDLPLPQLFSYGLK